MSRKKNKLRVKRRSQKKVKKCIVNPVGVSLEQYMALMDVFCGYWRDDLFKQTDFRSVMLYSYAWNKSLANFKKRFYVLNSS
jgi:hypothetical protein